MRRVPGLGHCLVVLAIAACTDGAPGPTGPTAVDVDALADAAAADAALDAGPEVGAEAADSLDASTEDAGTADTADTADTTAGPPPCPAGMLCPAAFPYSHAGDTAALPPGTLDAYACKPTADESGPEQVYRIELSQAGFLSAAVYDDAGVDVDVHILGDLTEAGCLDRGDKHARADVGPGTYYVVVDTFVAKGQPQAGKYTVDIGFLAPSAGPCALQTGVMKRVNDGGQHLAMPATGPIVMEAHLVTQEEPPPYPASYTDELAAHKALSQSKTGLVMHRTQVWAPLEGGSFYGAGIGSPTLLPVVDEGWYVNMYWTKESRPPRGTRMLLRLAGSSRAVVVSAGHETGPGNLAHVGGTPEETHFYLGTKHLSPMLIGIAVDQTLPFGPRVCQ